MKLYVYRKPNSMIKHTYTDDVAIAYANSLEEAREKFEKLYNISSNDDIHEVEFNKSGVAILTDY